MPLHRHHLAAATASAGLILSLQSELPASSHLARRARLMALRLGHDPDRHLQDRAAAILAALLDATDSGLTYAEDGCLDDDFDAL